MNLSDFLRDSDRRIPYHSAITFEGRTATFSELDRWVDSLARGLEVLGLKPRDRCVLMMPNSINWVLAYYALARLGAVVVPVNPVYRKGELAHIFSDSGARVFLGHSDYLKEAAPVIASLPKMSIRLVDRGKGEVPPGFLALEDSFRERERPAARETTADDHQVPRSRIDLIPC